MKKLPNSFRPFYTIILGLLLIGIIICSLVFPSISNSFAWILAFIVVACMLCLVFIDSFVE